MKKSSNYPKRTINVNKISVKYNFFTTCSPRSLILWKHWVKSRKVLRLVSNVPSSEAEIRNPPSMTNIWNLSNTSSNSELLRARSIYPADSCLMQCILTSYCFGIFCNLHPLWTTKSSWQMKRRAIAGFGSWVQPAAVAPQWLVQGNHLPHLARLGRQPPGHLAWAGLLIYTHWHHHRCHHHHHHHPTFRSRSLRASLHHHHCHHHPHHHQHHRCRHHPSFRSSRTSTLLFEDSLLAAGAVNSPKKLSVDSVLTDYMMMTNINLNQHWLYMESIYDDDPVWNLPSVIRFLACDCRLRWVARWIRDHDLQVGITIFLSFFYLDGDHLGIST